MLKILFGSPTGILAIITVVGALTVILGASFLMYRKAIKKGD